MMVIREILRMLLILAGIVTVGLIGFLVWRIAQTVETFNKQLPALLENIDSTLQHVDGTLDEVSGTLADVRREVLPLAAKAGEAVDTVNAELKRVEGIIDNVKASAEKVEKTSDSITGIMNAPADTVAGIAKRAREAMRLRKVKAEDALKTKAQYAEDSIKAKAHHIAHSALDPDYEGDDDEVAAVEELLRQMAADGELTPEAEAVPEVATEAPIESDDDAFAAATVDLGEEAVIYEAPEVQVIDETD